MYHPQTDKQEHHVHENVSYGTYIVASRLESGTWMAWRHGAPAMYTIDHGGGGDKNRFFRFV